MFLVQKDTRDGFQKLICARVCEIKNSRIYYLIDCMQYPSLHFIEQACQTADDDFKRACCAGHLNEARLIWDIAAWNMSLDDAVDLFYKVCLNGHLAVAQWLLCVEPTLINNVDYVHAYMLAYWRERMDVAQWLLEYNPAVFKNVDMNHIHWQCRRAAATICG